MTADMFLGLKHNDRQTRFARDNSGSKSSCTRTNHHHICLAIPLARNLRSLSRHRAPNRNAADCRRCTTRYEQIASIEGH
jgi:hypothetical protein